MTRFEQEPFEWEPFVQDVLARSDILLEASSTLDLQHALGPSAQPAARGGDSQSARDTRDALARSSKPTNASALKQCQEPRDDMQQLIVSYLVCVARKREAVFFEDHMRLLHELVLVCARLSFRLPSLRVRPSWLSGYRDGEVATEGACKRIEGLADWAAKGLGAGGFLSLLQSQVLVWGRQTPFVCLCASAQEVEISFRNKMLLASAAKDNLVGCDMKEWILVEWPVDSSCQEPAQLQDVLDAIASTLSSSCRLGETRMLGLPFSKGGGGELKQNVCISGSVRMTLDFSSLSEWMATFKVPGAPDVSRATRSLLDAISSCYSSQGEDSRQSPFQDDEARATIVQPACRASPRVVHSFAQLLKQSEKRRATVEWPFWITRRCPVFLWREGGVQRALVRSPLVAKHAHACQVDDKCVWLAPSVPSVSVKVKDPLLSRLESVGAIVKRFMYDLFVQDNKLLGGQTCALFDLGASESRTHRLWRSLQRVELERMAHEASCDVQCIVWQ